MKAVTTLICSLLFCSGLPAQPQRLMQQTVEAPFRIVVENDQVLVRWSKPETIPSSACLLTLQGIHQEQADLQIDCRLTEKEKDFYYHVALTVHTAEGEAIVPAPFDLPDNLRRLSAGAHRITWTNALEHNLEFDRNYTLLLEVELWGQLPVDCANPPAFGLREQWPNLAGAAVGAGLIAVGQVYRQQSNQEYRRYKDIWQRQADPEYDGNAAAQALIYYQNAEKKDNAYQSLTWAGVTVLVLDAAWYTYRRLRFSQSRQRFDEYCRNQEPFSLRPVFLPSTAGVNSGVGLKLTIPLSP